MNFIEELYYGNISPHSVKIVPNKKYAEASKLVIRFENELKENLAEPQLTAFNRMLEANEELYTETELMQFKLGFRLGIQMMIDALSANNEIIE